jgi:hypothetical protein
MNEIIFLRKVVQHQINLTALSLEQIFDESGHSMFWEDQRLGATSKRLIMKTTLRRLQ